MQLPRTMQHPMLGQIGIWSTATSDIPDDQVYDTVTMMIGYAQADSMAPAVRELAEMLTVPGDPAATVSNIWNWVNSHITFKLDEEILRMVPGAIDPVTDNYGIECLIRPVDMLTVIRTQGRGVGDCDDHTMLVCALMLAAGIPCSVVTIGSVNSPDPGVYSHVYAAAYPAGHMSGARIAMDASHGDYPGWEAPVDQISRKNEYPVGSAPSSVFTAVAVLAGAWWLWSEFKRGVRVAARYYGDYLAIDGRITECA